jgi:hypothetical protein
VGEAEYSAPDLAVNQIIYCTLSAARGAFPAFPQRVALFM